MKQAFGKFITLCFKFCSSLWPHPAICRESILTPSETVKSRDCNNYSPTFAHLYYALLQENPNTDI